MRQIYNRTVAITVPTANTSSKAESKEGKNGNQGETTIHKKLRGVNIENYYTKAEERETYKMLSQIEFNSFKEQAQLCAKINQ